MAGKDNLRVPTSEQARLNGKKGGIASAQARSARKTMRAELEAMLSMAVKDKNGNPTDKTYQSAITAALIAKAAKGDTKAFELIRDTIGEKPAERITLASIDQETIDAVEKMVMGRDT